MQNLWSQHLWIFCPRTVISLGETLPIVCLGFRGWRYLVWACRRGGLCSSFRMHGHPQLCMAFPRPHLLFYHLRKCTYSFQLGWKIQNLSLNSILNSTWINCFSNTFCPLLIISVFAPLLLKLLCMMSTSMSILGGDYALQLSQLSFSTQLPWCLAFSGLLCLLLCIHLSFIIGFGGCAPCRLKCILTS